MAVHPRFTVVDVFHENIDSPLNFNNTPYLSIYITFHELPRCIQELRVTDMPNLIIMNKMLRKWNIKLIIDMLYMSLLTSYR